MYMFFSSYLYNKFHQLGGQLKTFNGQKYTINNHQRQPDGFFISKSHAILIAALIAIVMTAYAVLMYFLFASR